MRADHLLHDHHGDVDRESRELLERTYCNYGECVSEDVRLPSGPEGAAEVAESDPATAAETATSEPVHTDIGETVARDPSAESGCPSCTSWETRMTRSQQVRSRT